MKHKSSEHKLSTEKYVLEGLACTNCAAKIEKKANELEGIERAELNFTTGTIYISGKNEIMDGVESQLKEIVSSVEPGVIVKEKTNEVNKGAEGKNNTLWMLGTSLFFFVISILLFEVNIVQNHIIPYWFEPVIYGISYILAGWSVLNSAFRNIGKGQLFDENFLMVIATLGAFTIGEYPEGVAVMLFYMIGEVLQGKAVENSRKSIAELMDIRPDYANKLEENKIRRVSPEMVHIGDKILIKPGEKVPLDGKIVDGEAMVDATALTGESVPRHVEKGDKILNGMVNQNGLITVEVEKEFRESTVAKILDLVENASNKKAPTEKFITKFARYYTPVVVYTALAIAIIPSLLLPGANFKDWLYRSLIFLVVSCPCALVVSIPLGFFGGIGSASRQGILVKGGNYLEALNQVEKVVFDKTGTLTKGIFKVSRIEAFDGFQKEDVLKIAALAEMHSSHPIAKSILEAYGEELDETIVGSYKEIAGQGIKAYIEEKEILVGNKKLIQTEGIKFNNNLEEEGSIIYVVVDKILAGYICISDEIKKGTIRSIKKLKEMGIKEIVMLTGDRQEAGKRVAEKLGIDQVYAELLPHEKVEKIEEILKTASEKGRTVFVGDGINDAPVLARADIGVAMGGLGSDAAIEAADIVLMDDKPGKLISAVKTARLTRKIVWQNIILALGIKGIVLVLGALGLATMWGAVFADVGVALLAVFNSMRILRRKV